MKKELKLNALARIIGFFELKGKTKYILEKIAAAEYNGGVCDSLVDFLSASWEPDPRLLDSMNGVKKKDFDAFLVKRKELYASFVRTPIPFPVNRMAIPGIPPMGPAKKFSVAEGPLAAEEFRDCNDVEKTFQTLLAWTRQDQMQLDVEEEAAIKRLLRCKLFRRDVSTIVKLQRIIVANQSAAA